MLPRVRVVAINTAKRTLDAGAWTLTVGSGLDTIDTEKKENEQLQRAIALTPGAAGLNGHVAVLEAGTHPGPFRWIGIDNRYFLAALLPSPDLFAHARTELPHKLILTAKPVAIAPGGSFTWEVPYYLGAKGPPGCPATIWASSAPSISASSPGSVEKCLRRSSICTA